jgi:hypothetical protein
VSPFSNNTVPLPVYDSTLALGMDPGGGQVPSRKDPLVLLFWSLR